MNNFLNKLKTTIKIKKGLLVFLILFTITLIIVGVVAAINFPGEDMGVNLENIAYVQFLKNGCSFFSLIFKLILSLTIFTIMMCLCGIKSYLFPLSLLFYGYLIYNQTFVLVSVILIYGFFNCAVFILFLLIFIFLTSIAYILITLEISCCCNCQSYFKTIFDCKNCNFVLYILCVMVIAVCFCLVLSILKSFVLLLVY